MVVYACENCLKIFNKKSGYILHTKHRKTPCKVKNYEITQFTQNLQKITQFTQKKPNFTQFTQKKPIFLEGQNDINIDEDGEVNTTKIKKIEGNIFNCEFCNKNFKRLFNLKRHLNICNCKTDILYKLEIENEMLIKNHEKKNEENEKIKDEVKKLNNSLTNNNVIINNGIINNNININIVNYGDEDLSKLDIKKILQYDNSFIEMVFRDIHCNSDLPENQNILLPSLTRYDIYVKLNNEWLKRNKKEILTERYTSIRGHIMDLYDKDKQINKNTADNTYFHFLKQIKLVDPSNTIYKPQEEKKIIDGMANVLYNHKNNIKSIVKTPLIKHKK
jgi:hypothetical protein